jgi:hypothetical protein
MAGDAQVEAVFFAPQPPAAKRVVLPTAKVIKHSERPVSRPVATIAAVGSNVRPRAAGSKPNTTAARATLSATETSQVAAPTK